jgi:hypothetical protein
MISSLMGIFFIFVLFPFLAYEGDQSLQGSLFHRYITPISIFISMGSSLMASICVSIMVNGDNSKTIRVKDILNAIVAGGIISGAASFYITSPFLAIIAGSISGSTQYLFDNIF